VGSGGIVGNIPNIITLLRLFAVPLLVWLVLHGMLDWAFWVFVAAGVSDGLDGFIAKRYGLVTPLGAYLDPIADKALLVSAYVTLGHAGYIDTLLVILVVFRDVLIVGGTVMFHALDNPVEMKPIFISKFNMLMQIVLVSVVLANRGIGLPDYGMLPTLSYLVGVTTVLSGLAYLGRWVFGVRVVPPEWSATEKTDRLLRRKPPGEGR
jgi:cardiolipin synthase (CMP-forming)